MILYLDWNILNIFEKLQTLADSEKQIYTSLKDFVMREDVLVPYSNAHLNDLLRGFKKDPSYIDGHLSIIEEITENLCICQYWERSTITAHVRSVKEFFYSALKENEFQADSYETLMDNFEEATVLWRTQLNLLESIPVPVSFKSIYKEDPIFSIIYPRTKNEMNYLALCSDLYSFSMAIHKDFSLYKAFRKFLINTFKKLGQASPAIQQVQSKIKSKPEYLKIEKIIDEIIIDNKSTKNLRYDHVLDTFFKFDLKAYKPDEKFSNLIDDGLHSFYGSYCDFFITNDDRCKQKTTQNL